MSAKKELQGIGDRLRKISDDYRTAANKFDRYACTYDCLADLSENQAEIALEMIKKTVPELFSN